MPLSSAQSALVAKHLELVEKLVSPLDVERAGHVGLERDDLISEGNLGLIHAAETFDPSRGAQFSTWAGTCIRNAVRQAIRAAGAEDAEEAGGQYERALSAQAENDGTEQSDARLLIKQLMPQLAARDGEQAEAVRLHYLRGLNKAQVAQGMGITPTHAARLIKDGLAQLRQLAR